jgi:hypothetical protein
MKRKSEPIAWLAKRTFATLLLFAAMMFACHDGNQVSNGAATTPTNPTPSQTTAVEVANRNQPVASNTGKSETGPSIKITEVPSSGAGDTKMETIAGTVSGVQVKECKVVIFAHTNIWYVQPYIGASDTVIQSDNTWRSDTFLGWEYAALLVKNSYKPPSTTGKLPDVGGLVLAIDRVEAKK